MIDIEVKGRLGQYIKAVLLNVLENDAIISYPSRDVQASQTAEVLFAFADIQATGQAGDISGALSGNWNDDSNYKADALSLLEDQTRMLELASWWPCRVQRMRDEVAVIKLQVNAPSDATANEVSGCSLLSNVTDIVNRNTLRSPCADATAITASMIYRHSIEIPKDLEDFAANSSVHTDFLKHCGGPTSLFYDADTSALVVISTDEDTIHNVALLEETHLKMLRQKWAITRSLRQTMRSLEGSEVSSKNLINSRGSGDWDSEPGMFYERFYVPQRLMGLAIGAQGNNIRAAREVSGVVSIRLREPGSDQLRRNEPLVDPLGETGEATLFVIEAESADAAKQARARLEFTELYLGVPRRYVGRLIGRRTMNIHSIIQKSGVIQIHFDDHIKGPSDDDTLLSLDSVNLNHTPPTTPACGMRRVFLRAGDTQTSSQPHADEEYGGFVLSGTREAVDRARLLISFQLDYILDLEKMEAQRVSLMRSLPNNGIEPTGPYDPSRGYPDGPVNRWADRARGMPPPMRGPGGGGRGGVGGGGRGMRRGVGAGGPAGMPYYHAEQQQYADNGSGMPYNGGADRRPPRNPRVNNGGDVPPRSRRPVGRGPGGGGGGGGGLRRGGPGNVAPQSDWNDVADRYRGIGGSEDSGSNLSHDVESDEQADTAIPSRYMNRNGGGGGGRGQMMKRSGNGTNGAMHEDSYPDGMPGEAAMSNGTPRARANHPVRRLEHSDDSSDQNTTRVARGPRNRPWIGSNGESSGSNRSSHLSGPGATVKPQVGIVSSR